MGKYVMLPNKWAWTKKKAKERAEKLREKGYNVVVKKAHTTKSKKEGYVFGVMVNSKGKAIKKK